MAETVKLFPKLTFFNKKKLVKRKYLVITIF